MTPINEAETIIRNLANTAISLMADQAAEVATLDGIAMVKKRLQQKGQQASGEPFSGYSIRPVPIYYYKGRSRLGGDAAMAALKRAHPNGLASYTDWRVVNNLQVGYKDFTFTGRLLATVKIIDSTVEPGYVTKTFGAPDDENKKKLIDLYPKHGNILIFSTGEESELSETFREELIDRLTRYLQ